MKRLVWFTLVAAACSGFAQTKSSRTVLDGVYTEAQAKRGEAEYSANCAKCHDGADVDGPPLTGDPFIDRWREDSLASLFSFIKAKMPRDTPGKLSDGAYRDIVAYILQANEYPAGNAELTVNTLASTQLVGKDGPKPLPTNALVAVVGCLIPGEKDEWVLTDASEPVRTRTADATTPEELNISAARPLGTLTFKLQGASDFKPETYKAHKVQVKGVLVRQSNNDRIHVNSLEAVGQNCK